MLTFTWGVLGLAAFLLLSSGMCRLVAFTREDRDWRRLSVRLFRHAKVLVLLWINGFIYTHLISGLLD